MIKFAYFNANLVKLEFEWLEIIGLDEVPRLWSAFQQLLDDVARVEDMCHARHYKGWIARTKQPAIMRHVSALGAKRYATTKVDGKVLECYAKLVKRGANSYSLREHMKCVREGFNVRVDA